MLHFKKETLLYIEPYYNEDYNRAITENYHFIADSFRLIDIPFIYLPKLLTDSHINKVLEYNHPYLKDSHQIHPEKLYHVIGKSLCLTIDEPTLLYLSESGEVAHQFDLSTPELFTSPERFSLLVEEINNKINPIVEETNSIRFRKASKKIRFDDDRLFESIFDDSEIYSKKEKQLSTSYQKAPTRKTADDLFEEVAFKIPTDLQKQIEALSEAGYLTHLIKYLEILQQTTQKLSRLKITTEYKIYLMDYEMKEVEMSPLPKALYFLFLNYPEGISFKALPDYRSELMTIYKNISLRENPMKARISIKKLTDPFDNSVHEKCSRIRAAFLSVVAEDIAANYFITGERGEPKKIVLNRELIIYDK